MVVSITTYYFTKFNVIAAIGMRILENILHMSFHFASYNNNRHLVFILIVPNAFEANYLNCHIKAETTSVHLG
jgi:hypothetical protein